MEAKIENHLGLVHLLLGPYKTHNNFDDLLSRGLWCAHKALGRWTPERGEPTTFVGNAVKWSILKWKKQQYKFKGFRWLDEEIAVESLASPIDTVLHLISLLPARQRAMMEHHFEDEITLTEVGAMLGLGKERVRQIIGNVSLAIKETVELDAPVGQCYVDEGKLFVRRFHNFFWVIERKTQKIQSRVMSMTDETKVSLRFANIVIPKFYKLIHDYELNQFGEGLNKVFREHLRGNSMTVLSFVSRRRTEFILEQIHRANPHFGNLNFVDFDTQEVISSHGYEMETHEYKIENNVLIYRGLRFTL